MMEDYPAFVVRCTVCHENFPYQDSGVLVHPLINPSRGAPVCAGCFLDGLDSDLWDDRGRVSLPPLFGEGAQLHELSPLDHEIPF